MRQSLLFAVIGAVAAISTVAMGGETISNSTRQDLLNAMKAEAFAYLKYTMFAEQARKSGNEVLAGIFEHTADDEFEKHFKAHAKLFGLVKSDYENLLNAMSAEFVEAAQMYQEMAKRAEAAGDAEAAKYFAAFARDEQDHRDIFKSAIAKQGKGN